MVAKSVSSWHLFQVKKTVLCEQGCHLGCSPPETWLKIWNCVFGVHRHNWLSVCFCFHPAQWSQGSHGTLVHRYVTILRQSWTCIHSQERREPIFPSYKSIGWSMFGHLQEYRTFAVGYGKMLSWTWRNLYSVLHGEAMCVCSVLHDQNHMHPAIIYPHQHPATTVEWSGVEWSMATYTPLYGVFSSKTHGHHS